MRTMRVACGFSAVFVLCSYAVCLAVEESEDDAVAIVLEILKSGDQEMQAVAIAMAKEMEGPEITKALAKELPNLSATSQVQLLSALGDRGDVAALPAVIAATKAANASVRIAALKGLGQLGDASIVMLLAEKAAATSGDEQKAAQESLYRLRGAGVDEAILAGIAEAEPKVKVELISSLGRRNVYAGVNTLLKTAKDADRKVRVESFKVLGAIARPDQLPALVDLLINVKSSSDRTEAEKTVAVVAHKIKDKGRQAEAVLAKLPSVKDIKSRSSLLSALGRIGDNSALPALRKELGSKEPDVRTAAIRALSAWPTPEPVPDLLKLAQGSKSQLHRILALRGFVRLLGLESKRPVKETIQMYARAMALAPNAMEKRRVLSGLSSTPGVDTLKMAAGYLEDKELFREAEVAIVKIAESIYNRCPQESRDVLTKIIASTKNKSLRGQAREVVKKIEQLNK